MANIRLTFVLLSLVVFFLSGCNLMPSATRSYAERKARLRDAVVAIEKEYPNVSNISAERARALRPESTVFIDARTLEEREVSMLPNAVSLHDPQMAARVADAKEVIVYCTVGQRSAEASEALNKIGVPAKNLAGGIIAWLYAGGEVVDASGKVTKRVHVYSRRWDVLPKGFVAVTNNWFPQTDANSSR